MVMCLCPSGPHGLAESVCVPVSVHVCDVVRSWQHLYITSDIFICERTISACGSFLYFKLVASNYFREEGEYRKDS